ncbi:MAG: hypothetical protein IIY55_12395 [Blautia sp.]|nr:hypothetical protein [Blautia sp.]
MSNKEIYQRTLKFSLFRFLYSFLAFIVVAVIGAIGFMVTEKTFDNGLIGMGIGIVVGLIALAIFLRYVSYTYKAGQIAMMTQAITTGSLPKDVVGEGKRVVKERFATVALFFAATGIIKGIFNQLGRGMTKLGEALGGDSGKNVASVISAVIQVVIAYLCDCCLGWVFYRKEQSSAKATLEGAVLFFRHGKTFARNMGRVFGMGLASLLVIGGAFSGIFYLIASRFNEFFVILAGEFTEIFAESEKGFTDLLQSPSSLMVVSAVVAGLIVWGILHTTLVQPFVLTGVLRNYLESGMHDIPTESSFAMLDSKSAKFKKLHSEAA